MKSVGRDDELAHLDNALADARRARGGAVLVVGEPGIGKSRLATEAASRASATGMCVLRGRGSTVGPMVAYRPLTEALLPLFRAGDPLASKELGSYQPVLGTLIPDWSHTPAPGKGSPIVLAEAVLRLTTKLGADRGCVLILEDLHSACDETLAVVEYLIDNVERLPIVLVATIRDEPSAALDLARSSAQRGLATMLELRRLDQRETSRLVASCLGVSLAEVPARTAERLWEVSAGVPLVADELLRRLVDRGWHEVDVVCSEAPPAVLHTIGKRVDGLPEDGRTLLSAAAILGERFSLPVVRRLTGMDERAVHEALRTAVAAHVVVGDEPAPDWYSFRYPLTGPALLAGLTPFDRADLSRRAADAIEALHPGLPGQWCQLVASLRWQTGDPVGAARLLATEGRRALADGATEPAIGLLERAAKLAGDGTAEYGEILEPLLYALTETGRLARATELAKTLLDNGVPVRSAAVHARLAWGARLAGRHTEAWCYLDSARALLGPNPAGADVAPLDAVASALALTGSDTDLDTDTGGTHEAEMLAGRALRAAEQAGLPETTCQSLLVVGTIARERDVAESDACFEKARLIASEHRMPIWGAHALARHAENRWLFDGDGSSLIQAHDETARVGAAIVQDMVDANLAMHAVLCGRFTEAARLVAEKRAGAGLDTVARHRCLVAAVRAAHQGQRRDMDEALAEYRCRGGADSPLTAGMARAFCALLEEDRDRARRDLAGAPGADVHALRGIAGQHGLRLLLDVLHGAAGWQRYDKVAGTVVSRTRWNHQFVVLAQSVLLGRSGQLAEAVAAVEEARQLAAPYPMARHLGLRLVAEAAYANEWGEPENWLRLAEEHFHKASVPAVASACRAMLRRSGAHVPQRRTDTDRVPAALRALGVTGREYEVFRLVAHRLGNKAIAGRLHISPRTVEKHVANLVVKTSRLDREELNDYAAEMLADNR